MLRVTHLSKIYNGKVPYRALTDVSFHIEKGEFVGIMGPSGSGKTTLLNMIATIDKPTSGEVLLNRENPFHLSRSKMALFRRRNLGFVFQDFNLLDTMTLAENIVVPLALDYYNIQEITQRLQEVTRKLGISEILDKRTYEVSGGQLQRAAIARAIIHSPALLLADEPTGNLDSKASRVVMELLETINHERGTTMMMVTHDPVASSYCDRVLFIKDGKFYNEIQRGESRQVFFQQILDVLALLGGNTNDLTSLTLY
ncbi:ABC transporter ATP-binding protein [Brevibacillus daliensis]|uniref:ABC transporter ATP-binding protein n=1 Tax=Brevibacillus daliensis TaxID=2892995 RepID=UPI001E295CBA|nr:ABC transporter ATP-binding protein [Brevibacillus daliensis]